MLPSALLFEYNPQSGQQMTYSSKPSSQSYSASCSVYSLPQPEHLYFSINFVIFLKA